MKETFEIIATTVEAATLIMTVVFLVSIMFRKSPQTLKKSIYMGGLFSFAVFITMADPLDMGKYGIYDLRSLLIGAAAAILGPIAGLMTVVVAAAMRITLGGAGMIAGLISIGCAFAGGLIWRYTVRDKIAGLWVQSVLLGVLITFHTLGIFAFPADMWSTLAVSIIPPYLVVNILGAVMINFLVSGEKSFLSEAESSKHRANTDHLTGLLNRRGLEDRYPVTHTTSERDRGRALLCFDIDNFKGFNDSHGHKTGDEVLRYVTKRIGSNLRPNDIFARLGGDEFAVVLNQIDAVEAEKIAERCRKVVAAGVVEKGDVGLSVSISIGAIWMLGHTEVDEILDQADQALYSAKKNGRNAVVFRHAKKPLWTNQAVPAT